MSWLLPEAVDVAALDVYYDPAYLRSVVGGDEVRVLCAPNLILPLVLRRLPEWLGEPGMHDAESPYGYAAPLVSGPVDWDGVRAELARHGVVNAFVRSHPLQEWCDLPALQTSATAVIPLAEGRALAFTGGRCATHRSQVNRGKALGFTADIIEAPADLAQFQTLYERTMTRLQAAESYRFPAAAWHDLAALGNKLALITVRDGQAVVHAQALFLRGPRYAHYHLSARIDEAHNAAGHLQFEAAADWAAAHGCQALHLGGGTSGREDDGLLAFKRRIGRGDAIFRVGGLIADAPRHQQFIARWTERSGQSPRWFQAYRQPLAAISV